MAQHIGCQLENERGKLIKDSELNFASINRVLWDVDVKKEKYKWLDTIDEYGNTVFNPLQVPIIVAELEKLKSEVGQEMQNLITKFVEFIQTIGVHQYIKFIGD